MWYFETESISFDIKVISNVNMIMIRLCFRRWKQFYVVLKDGSLHFFDDQNDAEKLNEALHSLSSRGSKTEVADDYHKRKNVFRFK